jgi:hypothetical protein
MNWLAIILFTISAVLAFAGGYSLATAGDSFTSGLGRSFGTALLIGGAFVFSIAGIVAAYGKMFLWVLHDKF